jgi:hypothetical protein
MGHQQISRRSEKSAYGQDVIAPGPEKSRSAIMLEDMRNITIFNYNHLVINSLQLSEKVSGMETQLRP